MKNVLFEVCHIDHSESTDAIITRALQWLQR